MAYCSAAYISEDKKITMEKLDLVHHKIILLCITLVMVVTGIFFGVTLSAKTQGTDGMLIILFSLCFLTTTLLFLVFIQLMHLREDVQNMKAEQNAIANKQTKSKK